MKPLVLLRPEPGLSESAARARKLGLSVIECPLFNMVPLGWRAPPADQFDALLLTSANAIQWAGDNLSKYCDLPVLAVGDATAAAARAAGLRVERTGERGVAELLADEPGARRLLHLAGQNVAASARPVTVVSVYASVEIENPGLPEIGGTVVAVHSPRAGRRLSELARDRSRTAIAAISPSAAQACGDGWARVDAAGTPDDAALLALAARLCQGSVP